MSQDEAQRNQKEYTPLSKSESTQSTVSKGEKKSYSKILLGPVLLFGFFIVYRYIAAILDIYKATGQMKFWPGLAPLFTLSQWDSNAFMIAFLIVGCLGYFVWIELENQQKNVRPKVEHGSAKKGEIADAQKIASTEPMRDIILSKNIRLDMNTRNTNLNDNVLVIGDSGSWKTMSYVKPNLLQMHSNYMTIDPKGGVIEEVGTALHEGGYDIRYLNLVNMEKSMGYNPFRYFEKPEDIQVFVNNLISNTTGSEKTGGDPFFEKAEMTLITALCFFVQHTFAGMKERNFNTVMDLLLLAEAKEEEGADTFKSMLDQLFDALAEEIQIRKKDESWEQYQFGQLAITNYKLFKLSAGKTAKSILVSVGVRLSVFNLPALKAILAKDELHLERLGTPLVKSKKSPEDRTKDLSRESWEKLTGRKYEELDQAQLRKTALFVIISDSDRTFSFLASIILQQVYDQLYRAADARADKALPIHARIINDEFTTTGKQMDIDIKAATIRSRNISASFIIQGLSQLQEVYDKKWEAIFENCSTTLFLGGKGPTTTDVLSKLIGNETVIYKSATISKGKGGGYSTTDQIYQRPLYGPDEINRIPTNHCLIHIRGHQIYEDEKYNLFDHPNLKNTVHADESNRFDIGEYKKWMDDIKEKRNTNTEQWIKDPSRYEEGFIDGSLFMSASTFYAFSDQLEDAVADYLTNIDKKEGEQVALFSD